MNISAIQANSVVQHAQTIADNFQSNVGGVARSALVEHNSSGYRAYLVPSLPGAHASGSTVSEAEANLILVLDVLA